MKINWFSPLPPARSGIAQQTMGLLPLLTERAEVTVWSSERPQTTSLPAGATLKQFDPALPPWREISKADISFYQMGNDPRHHQSIWRVSRQHPGVVILHDLKLQHFFGGLAQSNALGRREYLELIERYHGLRGRLAGESFLRGEISRQALAKDFPMIEAAKEKALAVVMHWQGALTEASPSVPVIFLPLPASGVGRQPEFARAGRPPNEPYRIIVFGFLGVNRRLPSCLNALAQFPDRERFRLDVYGTIEGGEKMEELITRLGLTSSVTLHGFVPEAELEEALRGADLAINLRNPTMGEASASQLQLWTNAVPTLVTPDGWYASSPVGTVGFVRPGCETADIQEHLVAFLSDPAKYRVIGGNGRRHVQEVHTFESYADGLMEVAGRVGEFQEKWIARHLARRAGAGISAWVGVFENDELLRGLGRQIQILAAPANCSTSRGNGGKDTR